ncbi:MAG: HlyD family efflux transporter periplasmic adaptor subunit [Myxococcales bacterium]|nr:HlyD family efflux transporter periplasmic adaptor subunit [Myxococcales bacterium]
MPTTTSTPRPALGLPLGKGELPSLRLVRHNTRLARTVARVLLASMVLVLTALILAPWQQSVRGQGRVIAFAPVDRQQAIEAPIGGRLVSLLVHEGQRVEAGDLIAEIRDNAEDFVDRLRDQRQAIVDRLQAAQNQVLAYEARITALQSSRLASIEAAESRVRMDREGVRIAEQKLEAAEAHRDTAELNLTRQRDLAAEGLTSTRSRELAELDMAKAKAEVKAAEANLASERSELKAAMADLRKVEGDTDASLADAQAKLESALSTLAREREALSKIDVELSRQSTQQVVAPRAGTVLRVISREGGELVKSGDPLAILVPDTESRAVEILVDGNDAALIDAGRPVRLHFEGWPAVQFSGWPSVAVGTFGGRVAFVDAADDGKGHFRVVVIPDADDEAWPSAHYLRQGVRANGWVLLDQVRLGYELWRLFNGFPPVVAQDEPARPDEGGKG